MGPLSLADLIGLDVVLDIIETLYQGFDDPKYRPSPLLKQMCHAGYLGKNGRGFFTYVTDAAFLNVGCSGRRRGARSAQLIRRAAILR